MCPGLKPGGCHVRFPITSLLRDGMYDNFKNQYLAELLLKCHLLIFHPPELQLVVAACDNFKMGGFLVGAGEPDVLDQGRMASVQRLGQADKHGQYPQGFPLARIQFGNIGFFSSYCPFPVEPCDICHERDLLLVESQQIRIFYEVI